MNRSPYRCDGEPGAFVADDLRCRLSLKVIHHHWLPCLVLTLISVAVFSRTLFFGYMLHYQDIARLYYPWQDFIAEQRLSGNWLPWCEYLGCGFPLWANGQVGIFYLPNLLFMAPLDRIWTLGFITFLHFAFAAIGVYALASYFSISRMGALISAVLFAFTGFMWAHHFHFPLACATAWMPWAILGSLQWSYKLDRWGLVLAVVAYVSILINFPHFAIFTVAMALSTVWAARVLTSGRFRDTGTITHWMRTVVPLFIGATIAAVQLFPLFKLMELGAGGDRDGYEFITSFSISFRHLITFVLPRFWGTGWFGGYWAQGNFWETVGYIGTLVLLLILLIVPINDTSKKFRLRLLMISACAILFALGGSTPLYDAIEHIPLLNKLRAPGRWLSVSTMSLSLCAGIAIQEMEPVLRKASFRRIWGTAMWAIALISVAAVLEMVVFREANIHLIEHFSSALRPEMDQDQPEYIRTRIQSRYEEQLIKFVVPDLVRLAIITSLAGWAVVLLSRARLTSRQVKWAYAALVIVEACWFACWGYPVTRERARLHMPTAAVRAAPENIEEGRIIRSFAQHHEISILHPNTNLIDRIGALRVYDSMKPPIARLVDELDQDFIAPEIAAAFGVKTVITDGSPSGIPEGYAHVTSFAVDGHEQVFHVYDNTLYRGLAWTLSEWSQPPEATKQWQDLVPLNQHLLSKPSLNSTLSYPHRSAANRSVQVLEWGARQIRLRVSDGPSCPLLITSAAMPGWKAWVNHEPAPLLVANGVLYALDIPSGPCDVLLRYTAPWLTVGGGFATIGILATIVLVATAGRSANRT